MKCYCNFFRCGNEVWIEGKKILNFVSFVSENTVMKLAETAEITLPFYSIAYLKGDEIITGSKIDVEGLNIKIGAHIQVYVYYHNINYGEQVNINFENDPEAGKMLVFDGFIKKIKSGFPTTLVCEDKCFILRFGVVNKDWTQETSIYEGLKVCCDVGNEAFKKYRSDNNLTGDYEEISVADYTATSTFNEKLWQGVSPFEAAQMLMRKFGIYTGIDPEGKLFMGTGLKYTQKKTIKLDTSVNVIERDVSPKNGKFENYYVTVNGYVNGKRTTINVGNKGNGRPIRLNCSSIQTREGLEEFANNAYQGLKGEYNSGTITTLLYPRIDLFDYVNFTDTLFPENSANLYVLGIRREFNENGYHVSSKLTNEEWMF